MQILQTTITWNIMIMYKFELFYEGDFNDKNSLRR